MTTMELIERGIGHNCLSDAYELGKADAIKEYKSALQKQFLNYDEHGCPCLSDVLEILDDCEIELKE